MVVAAAGATLSAVRPHAAPPVPVAHLESSDSAPGLARHLLLVVIDGLRWDIANDGNHMPRLSEAMRTHASGELWAGRITMTSSAVLAFGTGQRGELDQILENLHPPRVGFNDWLGNAKRAGLRLMGVGDRAWIHLYGEAFDEFRPDPEGVAIEADFNAMTLRNARELQLKSPDFLVVHFVTPDHQGHAYGIQSPRYARHVRNFDEVLFDWLDSLTPDWTVIVTSDHGAADSGTHGTDTAVQRRCPLTAWGPGIRHAVHRAVDQAEMPGLLSALLGVETAQQSRGTVPFEWLDESPDRARHLACREIQRLHAETTCCANGGAPSGCIEQARTLAARYDAEISRHQGATSAEGWFWLAAALLTALVVGLTIHGRRALAVIGIGLVWLAISLLLTYSVERLAGRWPNSIRALLLVLTNAVFLSLVVNLRRWAPKLEQYGWVTLSIVPGWLLVSYTANTQIEAYVALVVLGLACARASMTRPGGDAAASRLRIVLTGVTLLAAFGLLAIPGLHASDVCPTFFGQSPLLASFVAGSLLVAGVFWIILDSAPPSGARPHADLSVPRRQERNLRPGSPVMFALGASGIALLCFVLRHLNVSWVGRVAWASCALGTGIAVVAGRRRLALALGVASYVWVSRDFECIVIAPALVAAAMLSRFIRATATEGNAQVGRALGRWVNVTVLFALSYILWIGLQGGLQFENLDLAAGSFGDVYVPGWLNGTCAIYKFIVAEVLLVAVYTNRCAQVERARLLLGLVTAHLARGVALLLMLAICGHSYWTAFRVVADLPFAVVGLLGPLAVIVFGEWPARLALVDDPPPVTGYHCAGLQ